MSESKISAGSYDLNNFLHGGYETDVITTIYGKAGTGKTNLCLLASVSQAKKEKKAIFIDTEGGFSPERVEQLAGEETEKTMKNLMLLKPLSFSEQNQHIKSLLKEIKQKGQIGLIVVDGMTMLYRIEMAEAAQQNNIQKIREVNRMLATQMSILSKISRQYNITILITNQVYEEFLPFEELKAGKKPEINMVGGDILKYWSKAHILLENINGKRTLILKKHRSLPEKTLSFQITADSIKKRGWL